ncbi:hypothetical protein PHLCEN_2v6289 [Hermanssonia centrifuga]|uniref:Mid2 domain-containing protein n=1 Tax=Hermanssonia centrifuga TaxID=98765 RepID=A0A2R6NZV8_9APHY|nr:hypothetical protein PHLCEN_2v6289 [Hermanssonia centrifuga]
MFLGSIFLLSLTTSVISDSIVTADWNTDVFLFGTDWNKTMDGPCGVPDYSTTTVGSSAFVSFIGNQVAVAGMQNSANVSILVSIDSLVPFTLDLVSANDQCGTFFTYDLVNGTHLMILTLANVSTSVAQGGLHMSNITFNLPDAGDGGVGQSVGLVPTSSPAQPRRVDVAAIISGVVVGCVMAVLLAGIVFFLLLRRAKRSRHAFDPRVNNTIYVTELSPPDIDAKLQPYLAMKDIDEKVGHLDSPPQAYHPSDRKIMS